MTSIFHRHSRKLLVALLLPLAFGCQTAGPMSDLELSERMTTGSTDRIGIITLGSGKVIQGFFIAIRGDSLQWHEGMTMMTREHSIATDSVASVIVNGPIPYWAPVFGLGGCALGGCGACFAEAAADGDFTGKTALATGAGAVVGAAAGYGIGILSNPGKSENAWLYKIRKPAK